MTSKEPFSWLPHVGQGLTIVGIGVIIVGISGILPAFFVFFVPGPLGAGPLNTAFTILEAVGGVGVLVAGWGLMRIGNALRRRG